MNSKHCGQLQPAQTAIGNKSQKQVQAIWGLARKWRFDHESLHELVADVTGKDSIRALNKKEADAVIARLGGSPFYADKAGTPRRTIQYRRQKTGVVQLETGKQLKLMRDVSAKLGWNDETLKNFCLRQIKKQIPTTTKEAQKVIEPMKAMLARNKQEPKEVA